MFWNKKRELERVVDSNYVEWDKDLGFLNLIVTRKKNIIKNFLINTYSKQLKDTDFIRDDEIKQLIEKTLNEIMLQINGNYKDYIIKKYFGTEEELVKFVTEDVYVDLTAAAISENYIKIKKNVSKKRAENFSQTVETAKARAKKEKEED